MDSLNLKNQINTRINSIDDFKLLENIQQFLDTTSNKDLSELLEFLNENLQVDKKDYTSYIKEWVKSM